MAPDLAQYLLLIALGAWAAADGTSIGQLLLSRPIFAATLAGALAGDALAGVVIGAALEVFQLSVLPAGAARYPESGPAAVAGGAAYALHASGWHDLLVVLGACLLVEWLAGISVHRLRQFNMGLAGLQQRTSIRPSELRRRHLTALALDVLRGGVLTAAALWLLIAVLRWLPAPPPYLEHGSRLVVAGVVAALLMATARTFAPRLRLAAAGAAAGAALVILL